MELKAFVLATTYVAAGCALSVQVSGQDQAAECRQAVDEQVEVIRQSGHMTDEQVRQMADMLLANCERYSDNPVTSRTGQRDSRPSLPMSELTLDYMLGTWCKQSGQEDGPWVFAEDGSYQGGMPDSVQGYVMHPLGDSIEHFHDRWHRLKSKSENEFIVYPGRSDTRRTVFTRGDCDQPETLRLP